MTSTPLLLLLLLGGLTACSSGGALGQATLDQGCPATDPGCRPAPLDAPVAAGATLPLSVDFHLRGGGAPPLTLVSGNEDVFSVGGASLTGVAPGVASLLFTTEETLVLDFTTVWVPPECPSNQSCVESEAKTLFCYGVIL